MSVGLARVDNVDAFRAGFVGSPAIAKAQNIGRRNAGSAYQIVADYAIKFATETLDLTLERVFGSKNDSGALVPLEGEILGFDEHPSSGGRHFKVLTISGGHSLTTDKLDLLEALSVVGIESKFNSLGTYCSGTTARRIPSGNPPASVLCLCKHIIAFTLEFVVDTIERCIMAITIGSALASTRLVQALPAVLSACTSLAILIVSLSILVALTTMMTWTLLGLYAFSISLVPYKSRHAHATRLAVILIMTAAS